MLTFVSCRKYHDFRYEWWNLTVKNQQIATAAQLFEAEIRKRMKAE